MSNAAKWAEWLAEAERRLCAVYRLSPGHFIAECLREREITHGYHGREILELLQNAGDAAQLGGVAGRVHIAVTARGLVIGNTGQPFDEGGVESLQTANLSPKRESRGVMIGEKGLGFRSILNWTHSPLISSGDLGIAFLPSYAASVVRNLEEASDELGRKIRRERAFTSESMVPRLAFPEWIDDWLGHQWPEDEVVRSVASACYTLRREGFDTVIGMPFARKDATNEVIAQLDKLRPEFLLIVESISQVEIKIEGRKDRVLRRVKSGNCSTIVDGDREVGVWTVNSFDGKVSPELLDQEERLKNDFKLIVAQPESGQTGPGYLFCYFPTNAQLPLPILVHATLELDPTRKHVNDTRTNRCILGVLAEKIAELAEGRLARPSEDRWTGCRLVTPSGSWGGELERLGFAMKVKEAARRRKLVPVIGGGYRTSGEALWVPGSETKWWPNRLFPEITAFERTEESELAQHLEVERLASTEIVRRLLAATDLTIEERASAIAGLIQLDDVLDGKELSALLCDETGEPLPLGASAIFQSTGEMPKIPSWAAIRFLHPQLRRRLGQLLETSDARELQQKLKRFGIYEYSLVALIRPVLAEANRRMRELPESESHIRTEVLQFLLEIYRSGNGGTSFPPESSWTLPNQAGTFELPNQLYFGEGYDLEGSVTQDLYGPWAPEKLLAGPMELGLGKPTGDLTVFLQWLGVVRWPRLEDTDECAPEFETEVKNGLPYPVNFGDSSFESPQQLAGACLTGFKTVDGLEEILKNAPPEAVLAWLTLDSRSANWARAMPEHGRLKIRPPRTWYDRLYTGPVQSYAHWQIASAAWLPTMEGSRKAPKHCLIGDRQLEGFFPQPGQPAAKLKDRYGIGEQIVECYLRAGVLPGLAQMGRNELYRLLLEAPTISPDGKVSKALCRWLVLNEAGLFGFLGEHQKRFFREGRLWGSKLDQWGFFGITELHHVDFDGQPPALLTHLAIADLPKRVGAQKVKEVLGVAPLEKSRIRQRLTAFRKCPNHEEWTRWFEEAKPAIKQLRQAQTKQAQAVATLERLELILCDELQLQLQYENVTVEHTAKEGDWFIFSETLYVRGDLDDSIHLLADAAGVAIASVFGIADGDAFSKVLLCDSKSRSKLLQRMCGDQFQVEMKSTWVNPTYTGPIVPPTVPIAERGKTPAGRSSVDDVSADEVTVSDKNESPKKSPGITPIPHAQRPEKTPRRLVVRNIRRRVGSIAGLRTQVDGELSEKIAAEFETEDDPPRFPLGVGHLTGLDAPGFDLVSFDSAEDREAFLNPSTRNWEKARRFIEVKGRSSSTARIHLRGNELRAARKFGVRYYLYRIFEKETGQFIVSMLQDPVGAQEAQTLVIEIDLERAKSTQRYEFVAEGGIC